jgi:acetoin utilization deacetylase AcuC-like enzyme
MKPIRTAYSDAYYCETPQPSMRKLSLVARLAEESGHADLVKPEPVGRRELELIHHRRYVKSVMTGKGELAECAFGFWSEGYRDGVLAINGGNLLAARMAMEDGIAANVGQGFHHARAKFGADYCTFNGLALVAALNPDLSVLVIDCDEHAGDGTAEFTEMLPNLINFSICGCRMGCRESERSIVRNVGRHDEGAYRKHLREAMEFAASTKPSLVIYQAGMDPHEDDPLARSQMTGDFLRYRDQFVMETLALELEIPFFFVLAGGYQEPMAEKLVPLHVKTFEIAAKVKGQMSQRAHKATNREMRQPWAILHLPHDSKEIPERVREQFVLTDAELARELLLMA